MAKKAILAIVLIGIGCVVFFVVYEKDQKMPQEVLSEEPSVEQEVETEDVLIYWTNRSGRIQLQPPRIAAITRQPQPTINAKPPMGVIAPSHRIPVRLST